MPYQSRLSAVLLQRHYKEEEATRVFVEAKELLVIEHERLRAMDKTLQSAVDHLVERQKTAVSSEELLLYFRFLGRVREQVAHQEKAVLRQEEVCEVKRAILETAVKEKKAVKIIEEKRERAYFKGLSIKEQAVFDEIGGQRSFRKRHE